MQAIPNFILPLSDTTATLENVGGKGTSLTRLASMGLLVPDGFHITTTAYCEFIDKNDLQARIMQRLEGVDVTKPATLEVASQAITRLFTQAVIPSPIADAITQAYAELPGQDPPVAVRSSATAEDLPETSFAGQQETYLNVHGASAVLEAVKKCWASLWTARTIGYRERQGIDQEAVSLAVVVQLLVPAEVAGIMFTANPMNGRRDQIVINTSWGLGESIVGGAVTPDTLIVDKVSGQVIERTVADKQTMTVRAQEGTEQTPVPEELRRTPSLSDTQAVELAHLGIQIEQHYGMPMDIEWAMAGEQFFVLQARPVTALPEETLQVPQLTDWKLPDPKAIGFRASIIELLPDPLTPLFATLGRKVINTGTVQLFTDLFGSVFVSDEVYVTVNDYAYFQMRFTLKSVWQIFGGIISAWPILRRTEERWRDEAHPRYVAIVERWQKQPLVELTAVDLLTAVRQLMGEAVYTYNVLQSGVLGMAMGAEVLFTSFYDKLIKHRGDPPASTFLLGFDSMPILSERSLYDVAQWCREHPELADYLVRTPTAQLAAQLLAESVPKDLATDVWCEWRHRFCGHQETYGHAIYDLDFAKPVPADDPAPLLETVKMYLQGQGSNPYERQRALADRREEVIQATSGRLRGLRLKLFRKLLGWTHRYAPMREDSLADLGLGYPLLRQMLHELGCRLVQAGMIAQADDVYWLNETEVLQAATALDRGETLSNISAAIRQRKLVWQAEKRVAPPPGLPQRSRWMEYIEKVGPTRSGGETGDVIKGVGASPGHIIGTACVLHGTEDFGQMQPGDVLVAAITTPAWTPLFAMASAIVTDVGGPLSHGSIVAREYGIPAVLGTGVATRRIQDGQVITVDGDEGTVTLL
jgi:phosphohistidine swiveling domain-containing protein